MRIRLWFAVLEQPDNPPLGEKSGKLSGYLARIAIIGQSGSVWDHCLPVFHLKMAIGGSQIAIVAAGKCQGFDTSK